jgi:hypothetical protein
MSEVTNGYPPLDETSLPELVDRLVGLVKLAYADPLTAEEEAELETTMVAQVRAIETLRRYRLTNGDDVAFVVGADGRGVQ